MKRLMKLTKLPCSLRRAIGVGTTLTALLFVAACSRPGAVLDQDRMVAILVDVHKAEGVIEVQPEQYTNDSAKEWLVQSVLEKHGVTKADYDSSLVWYSTHLRDFIRVYDLVRTLVSAEQDSLKALLNVDVSSPAGDSVDLNREAPYWVLDPAHFTAGKFSTVAADSNFLPADSIALSFRLAALPAHCRAVATLTLAYDKDSMISETVVIPAADVEPKSALGAKSVAFGLRADSTLQLTQVLTSLYVLPMPDSTRTGAVLVDSLSLMRYHKK
jgi:hypothetical protein